MTQILSRLWRIGLRNRLPRYEEDDELRLSERIRKNKSIIVNSSEVDPNMFQQPGYNPFEMKFRNVNDFPLSESSSSRQNILSQYSGSVRKDNPYAIKSGFQPNYQPNDFMKMNPYNSNCQINMQSYPFNHNQNDTIMKSENTPFSFQQMPSTLNGYPTMKADTSDNFKKANVQSVYPALINRSYPFVINKLSQAQIDVKAKLKNDRQGNMYPFSR